MIITNWFSKYLRLILPELPTTFHMAQLFFYYVFRYVFGMSENTVTKARSLSPKSGLCKPTLRLIILRPIAW